MYLCVPHCIDYVLDNLWCSNSKNIYVPMFHPMLHDVFYPFSSILPILHVQSIYNGNKYVWFLLIFTDFFEHWKPQNRPHQFSSKSVCKPEVSSVYQYDSNFSMIWILCRFSTGFLSYADFWNLLATQLHRTTQELQRQDKYLEVWLGLTNGVVGGRTRLATAAPMSRRGTKQRN
jgi:hypothetical protein